MLGDGRLFVAGGHDGADTLGDNRASIFDPRSRSWSTVNERMSLGRWYPTATPLAGGDILVLSGSAAVGPDGLGGGRRVRSDWERPAADLHAGTGSLAQPDERAVRRRWRARPAHHVVLPV